MMSRLFYPCKHIHIPKYRIHKDIQTKVFFIFVWQTRPKVGSLYGMDNRLKVQSSFLETWPAARTLRAHALSVVQTGRRPLFGGAPMTWPAGSTGKRKPDKAWTYYRLYSDEAMNHYIWFMRTRPGEPDQYLMAVELSWHRDPRHYVAKIKITTPPANITRMRVLGGILVWV